MNALNRCWNTRLRLGQRNGKQKWMNAENVAKMGGKEDSKGGARNIMQGNKKEGVGPKIKRDKKRRGRSRKGDCGAEKPQKRGGLRELQKSRGGRSKSGDWVDM